MTGEDSSGAWYKKSYAYAAKKLRSEDLDFELEMRTKMEEGPAQKIFYEALSAARKSAASDGIRPELDDDGALNLSVRQAIKAACLAREDIETVRLLQLPILDQLDRLRYLERASLEASTAIVKATNSNRTLLWIITLLLIYIAIKL